MQEKYPEFTVMIQKPNRSPLNGKAHPLHIWRKWGKSNKKSRACWRSLWLQVIFHQQFVLPGQTVN